MIWEDVSANYSGVFFRVVGGEAGAFGKIQMENTNRISKVNVVDYNEAGFDEVKKNPGLNLCQATIQSNGSSKWIWTGTEGGTNGGKWIYVNFESTGGEIRSRNIAVKVWRRTS